MQTHIVLIVDKSGSMSNVTDDTIGGFNTYLKELEGTPRVSAMLFDTEFHVLFQDKTPKQAKRLSRKNYCPSGNTALLDAVGKTLTELEFPEGDKVLCVIQTDGRENSSTEFMALDVRNLVHERESEGWDFLYMGADQSAWTGSGAIGISREHTFVAPQATGQSVNTHYAKLAAASNSWSYGAMDPLGFAMDVEGKMYNSPIAAAAASYTKAETKEAKNVWTK